MHLLAMLAIFHHLQDAFIIFCIYLLYIYVLLFVTGTVELVGAPPPPLFAANAVSDGVPRPQGY